MILKAYLATVGMKMQDFADKIKCNNTYLSRLCNEKAYPGKRLSRDIYEATDGIVKMHTREEVRSLRSKESEKQPE